jgi:hypothetical protein
MTFLRSAFFSPLQGRDSGVGSVLCLLRRRPSLPKRPGPKSPPWRGRDRVGRWVTGPTVGASYYLPLFFSPLQGRDSGVGGVLCLLRRRSSLPKRPGPSPFSRGRRTGRGDGMSPHHLAPFSFYRSFSPLSRGETWGRTSCFAKKEGASPSRDGRAYVPSLEREGQGG